MQICVPEEKRIEVMKDCHDSLLSGHLGVEKTFWKCQERFYWPSMFRDIKAFVVTCSTCQHNTSKGDRMVAGKLTPIEVSYPFERISADILGPMPKTSGGHKYILVFTDYFTKWVEVVPLKRIRAKDVA